MLPGIKRDVLIDLLTTGNAARARAMPLSLPGPLSPGASIACRGPIPTLHQHEQSRECNLGTLTDLYYASNPKPTQAVYTWLEYVPNQWQRVDNVC